MIQIQHISLKNNFENTEIFFCILLPYKKISAEFQNKQEMLLIYMALRKKYGLHTLEANISI